MAETNIKIDPKDMEASLSMWKSFTVLLKRCSIATVIVLILMAIFLI